ncbi:MAG: hypothetical protein ACXAC7_15080 [Candidatus Hodarchaeales archaeon]|jgi:DNA-binding transcriptional regulator YiaG
MRTTKTRKAYKTRSSKPSKVNVKTKTINTKRTKPISIQTLRTELKIECERLAHYMALEANREGFVW